MPSFTTSAIRPGVYVRIQDVASTAPPTNIFIPTVIGLGRTTKLAAGQLTRGSAADGADELLNASQVSAGMNLVRVKSLVDSNGVIYRENLDFRVDESVLEGGDVGIVWLTGVGTVAPATGVIYTVSVSPLDDSSTQTYSLEKAALDPNNDQLLSPAQVASGLDVARVTLIDQYGQTYTEKTDFLVTRPSSNVVINWSPTGGTTKEPAARSLYTVTYLAPKVAADYAPKLFTSGNPADLVTVYGAETPLATLLGTYEGVDNTITLGGRLLLLNNAGALYCIQLNPADASQNFSTGLVSAVEAALDRAKSIVTRVIVPMVPMTSSSLSALIIYLKNHVETQSSTLLRHERVGIIGVPLRTESSNPTNPTQPWEDTAALASSSRMVVMAPSTATRTISGRLTSLDGSCLAAAMAGQYANALVDAGEPISGKQLAGFDSIVDPFVDLQKNRLLAAGVSDVEANFAILQALTTKTSSVAEVELKVTRIRDFVTDTMRDSLQKIYINTRNLGSETLSNIQATVKALLAQMITNRILVDAINVSVTQDTIDPRQINVVFQIRPAYDINYIYITFGVTFP